MKKREQGILTVEASIVLTLMLLFILFLFSFGRVYRAQSLVGHAVLQSADAVALESYLRETALQSDAQRVSEYANIIAESAAISSDGLESLRSANLPKIAKEKFVAAIAGTEAQADAKLRSMGVKDGLAGIDFSESKMDFSSDDVIIAINYTIEMQFPVFGFNEIATTKAAKAKTFGEILYEVNTKPSNPGWGSTTGDSKVVHGSSVEITATPNYGYKFVGWSDGVTENPRKVTVNDSQEYVAIFEKDQFGVNLSTKVTYNTSYVGIAHSNYGTVSGAGNYSYLDNATVKATPAANYQFVGWDDNGDGRVDNTSQTRTITVDKVYNLKAIFKPVTCSVTVKSSNNSYGNVCVKQGSTSGTTIQVEYGSQVSLVAASKDSVRYLFSKWSNNSTQSTTLITVKNSEIYEATFIMNTYTVTFYNGNSAVHSTQVIRGSSIDGSRNLISSSMPANPSKTGAYFDRWTNGGGDFDSATKVNSNISVYAAWNCAVVLDANGGTISNAASMDYRVSQGGSFNFSSYTPSRDGFTFDGWFVNGTKYTGSKTIDANVTVTAAWTCKHKLNNGNTMYVRISGSGGGCSNTKTTYQCKGCNHTYNTYGTGQCDFNGWCGSTHTAGWTGWCTTGSTHYWSEFGCITCTKCGKFDEGYVNKSGEYRSYYVWCIKHNGHQNRKVITDRQH